MCVESAHIMNIFSICPKCVCLQFRDMIVSILNESVAYKFRCIDYLNQTVRQRLFLSVSWSLPCAWHLHSGYLYASRKIM